MISEHLQRTKSVSNFESIDVSQYLPIVSILEEQVNFFENLFTSEGWDSDSAAYLLNNLEKKLSQDDKEICDEGITLDEISKAVKLQKPDKSLGEDGIVSEFYKHYWYLIGEDFESVVREIFYQKLLSESQNRGIITCSNRGKGRI